MLENVHELHDEYKVVRSALNVPYIEVGSVGLEARLQRVLAAL